jgi:integrase
LSRKRINTGASVLAQVKARAAAQPKTVVPLVPEQTRLEAKGTAGMLHARVDRTPDLATGTPRLRVIIASKRTPEFYDLSRLLVQPEIAQFFAEGFRQWAAGPFEAKSRKMVCQSLITGLGAFLPTLNGQVHLQAIDVTFWTSFIAWLNGPRKQNAQPWAHGTRARMHGAVRACIDALDGHPEHGSVATYLKDRSGFPRNPWPGRSAKILPTPVLSPRERRAMILACLAEVKALRERLEERDVILETGRALLSEAIAGGHKPPYGSDIGVCAARIADAFPDRLASLKDLFVLDGALGRAVQHKHRMSQVRKLLYATFRDLVPFVLLIGVKTAFNPDTILSLTWSRVQVSEDGTTVTFLGVKNRADDLQISINTNGTDAFEFQAEPEVPFALAEVLTLLRRLTERCRSILANDEHSDRLFIGVPINSGSDAKAFEDPIGKSNDIVWRYALEDFIREQANNYQLKPFTLKMLRFTEAEHEWRLTGDMLAVRDRLGHKSASTTRTHYTSNGMRRESQEHVAETQTLYHRWAETEGRSDPRHQSERCRSAATPGFGCLNPYDSPRPGQRKGKLCTAYGECPDCPLAQAWPQVLQAAAWYLALPKAIHDARLGRVSARHWVEKWKPILHPLNALLAEIPPHTRAEASRYGVKLKPVG